MATSNRLDSLVNVAEQALSFTSPPKMVCEDKRKTAVTTVPKMSGGKRFLSSTSSSDLSIVGKKMRGLSPSNDETEAKEDKFGDAEDDKDHDYVSLTNAAINSVMDEENSKEMATVVEAHCRSFMELAFNPDAEESQYDHPQKRSASILVCRPQIELDYIEYVVKNWQFGKEVKKMCPGPEKEQLIEFRRTHKKGNKYVHQYFLEEIAVSCDEEPQYVVRRKEKGKNVGKDRIVISRENLFQVIDECHRGNGHMGQERTWKYCKQKYYNVTERSVRLYSETCLVCIKKNPVTKNLKSCIKPIQSWKFRDRFQVDIIDFRKLRKRDPFGVLMRWVLTIMDHATRLTYLCALPRKHPHLVAYKLQEIFGLIGYPKIFHFANGNELKTKTILTFLRHLNPNILSVTGRHRQPNDQESFENMNKLVRSVLESVLAERRLLGESPNWTEVLGSVAAVINSQAGMGKSDVSAYESVFGQGFMHQFSCSKEDARKCWRIDEHMLVTNDFNFNKNVEMDYDLHVASYGNASDIDNYDVGYFTDDEVPTDETEEVTDNYFFGHLHDETRMMETYHDVEFNTMPAANAENDRYSDAPDENEEVTDYNFFGHDEKTKSEIYHDAKNNMKPAATLESDAPSIAAHSNEDRNSAVQTTTEERCNTNKEFDDSFACLPIHNKFVPTGNVRMPVAKDHTTDNDEMEASNTPNDNDNGPVGVDHTTDNQEIEAWVRPRTDWGRVSAGYKLFSIEEGWIQQAELCRSENKNNNVLHCCLYCADCNANSGGLVFTVPVGNTDYIHKFENTSDWYSHTFINGFIALVQHDTHMSQPPFKNQDHRIMLVYRDYFPQTTLSLTDILPYGTATHFVSVAFRRSHFVVLYYDIEHRGVTVFDGLSMSIKNWEKQIINTIKAYGLQSSNSKCRQVITDKWMINDNGKKVRDMKMELFFDDIETPWTVYNDRSYKQSDGVNCGPIACLKVMELYGLLIEGSIEKFGQQPNGYRSAVMTYYKKYCTIYNNALKVHLRTEEKLKAIREKCGRGKTTEDSQELAMDKKN